MQVRPFVNCDQEKIHLCGKIQPSGYLLVFDSTGSCVAYSKNSEDLFPETASLLGSQYDAFCRLLALEQDLAYVNEYLNYPYSDHHNRLLVIKSLGEVPYSLSFYYQEGLLFLEFEKIQSKPVEINDLYRYTKAIDTSSNDYWKSLCDQVSNVIDYDRVMVYRFLEDNSGQVMAENVQAGLEPLLGYRYPEFDIPRQARTLYKTNVARVTSDVNGLRIPVVSKEDIKIDLSQTGIRAMSPIHLEYLRNAKMEATCSFSILVNGELWGMVACQNRSPKEVDVFQRYVATILTQYTVNRFLALEKEQELIYQKEIEELLFEIKDKVIMSNDILESLKDCAEAIIDFSAADGMAVFYKDEVVTYRDTPSEDQIKYIKNELPEIVPNGPYYTQEFKYPEVVSGSDGIFPGIAYIPITPTSILRLILFRKEALKEEIWAGLPEKIIKTDLVTNVRYASPRTSFEAWKNQVRGKSEQWGTRERAFLDRLNLLIQESIVKKTSEIHNLNTKLKELNHLHDSFSHTISHDLKNMLSSVQLSAQMLERGELEYSMVKKLGANIWDSAKIMTAMLDKTLAFSRVKSLKISKEKVVLHKIIPTIIDDNLRKYCLSDSQFSIVLDDLLPIESDKTLVYQVFMNVISNAIKYSSKTERPQVSVRSALEPAYVVYSIADNGIGMKRDDIQKAFELFSRLPGASGFEGSGVGLSIVKRIMDRLGGQIDLDSEPDQGTTFHLRFPIK